MQRMFIQAVNCILLVVIFIGIPAVTRAQLGDLQVSSAPKLKLLMFGGLMLALMGNGITAAFLIKNRKEKKTCWEWAAVFCALLLAYFGFARGYFNFNWLKTALLWLQNHL
jgi:hypothetical protein